MTNTEKVKEYIESLSGRGVCDDCASKRLKIFPRQQINQITARLKIKVGYYKHVDECKLCKSHNKLITCFNAQK